MNKISFTITGDHIQLIKLLKATDIVDSGADAKELVDAKKVCVNGAVELRKRAQIKPWDIVTTAHHHIAVS